MKLCQIDLCKYDIYIKESRHNSKHYLKTNMWVITTETWLPGAMSDKYIFCVWTWKIVYISLKDILCQYKCWYYTMMISHFILIHVSISYVNTISLIIQLWSMITLRSLHREGIAQSVSRPPLILRTRVWIPGRGLTWITSMHEWEGKRLPAVKVILHQLAWLTGT